MNDDVEMETPGAGPSITQDNLATSTQTSSTAPLLPLPSNPVYSVEYPGYVRPTSIPLAVERLGGHGRLEAAFGRVPQREGKESFPLELKLHPEDPYSHPITGEVVSTSNLVLKVVKRKRKRREGSSQEGEPAGEYTAEIVGTIPKTGRFRSLADFQYRHDMSDPVAKLRTAMTNMDVEHIRNYSVPEEMEDYMFDGGTNEDDIDPELQDEEGPKRKMRSNLRLPPPPLFSRQGIPQNYNYKANTSSIITAVVDEDTGEEKKRLINSTRWKGYGPIAIYYHEAKVPNKPSALVEEQRDKADKKLLQRLEELFAERPVWTRTAILNQFEPYEVREIINSKFLLPLVSYVFQDGPWRDTQVRLGYDPRQDHQGRIYQRLYFRNTHHPILRTSVVGRKQENRGDAVIEAIRREDKRSHIFDGYNVTKETAAFQLCDIEDEMLKDLIEDEDELRETCHERDGWYTAQGFDRIKTVLRHKFFSLLCGHIATRDECEALLTPSEGDRLPSRSAHKVRPGKHNMAKGALRPEDAAKQRLLATIDEKVKHFSSQR
ncbi:hypothetical protein QCA50_001276 [Cerrena zonata]|uniref:Transcription factor IIIC subunit 5 HTH domain-containing protein n=1 Tax=Cerrena zonata TaxID=2478898 RepID=A0AAW0GZA3_9APHY